MATPENPNLIASGYDPVPVPGSGTSSFSSKDKSFNFTAKETAGTIVDQQFQQLFGRRATAAEKSAFFKKLRAAEKKYSTTQKGKSGKGYSSSTSTSYTFSTEAFALEYATSMAIDIIKSGKELGGDAGKTYLGLKTYADNMGITFNEKTGVKEALNVILGKKDETKLKQEYRNRAISLYGGLSQRLMDNPELTVRDAATDYINTMSKMLDIDPVNISLFDNTLSKALTATKDGKPYTKTLNEFRADLRADNRFQYSTMAHEEATNLGQSMARAFGFGGR